MQKSQSATPRHNQLKSNIKNGAPGEIRTPDRLVRSVPAEYAYPVVIQCYLRLTLSNKVSLFGCICLYLWLFEAVYWTAKVTAKNSPTYQAILFMEEH